MHFTHTDLSPFRAFLSFGTYFRSLDIYIIHMYAYSLSLDLEKPITCMGIYIYVCLYTHAEFHRYRVYTPTSAANIRLDVHMDREGVIRGKSCPEAHTVISYIFGFSGLSTRWPLGLGV